MSLAVSMPDGGLITPVLKSADSTDIYQLSRNWAVGLSSNTVPRLEACGLAIRRPFDDMLEWDRSSSTAHSFVSTRSMAGIARTIPKVQLGAEQRDGPAASGCCVQYCLANFISRTGLKPLEANNLIVTPLHSCPAGPGEAGARQAAVAGRIQQRQLHHLQHGHVRRRHFRRHPAARCAFAFSKFFCLSVPQGWMSTVDSWPRMALITSTPSCRQGHVVSPMRSLKFPQLNMVNMAAAFTLQLTRGLVFWLHAALAIVEWQHSRAKDGAG